MFRSPLADGGVLILLILLFAAPKRLPMLSRSIGESIKEFRGGINHHGDDKQIDPAPQASSVPPAAVTPSTAATSSTPTESAPSRDTVA